MDSLSPLYVTCLAASLCAMAALLHLALRFPRAQGGGATHPAFADLLDYGALVGENLILLKDGSLLALYALDPPDPTTRSEAEREFIASRLREALVKLSEGWTVHVDLIRRPERGYLPTFAGGNDAARELDRLRAQEFARMSAFSNSFYLCLTRSRDGRSDRLLTRLLERRGAPQDGDADFLRAFREEAEGIVGTLSPAFTVRPLGLETHETVVESAALSYIDECLCGRRRIVGAPRIRAFLDGILSGHDFTPGLTPAIDGTLIACVAIDGFPALSHYGILDGLSALPFPLRLSIRVSPCSRLKSSLLIGRNRRFWVQKQRGLIAQVLGLEGTHPNLNADRQVADLDEAMATVEGNEDIFAGFCANCIVMDRDPEALRQRCAGIIAILEAHGFTPRIETYNATEAFLGSLPGHTRQNLRAPLLSGAVVADLLPLRAPFHGEREAPSPRYSACRSPLLQAMGADRTHFYLNLHQQDLGNTLVIGPSGSGKSVLLGTLVLNLLRYPRMRIFAFDKGCSFYALTRALGGTHLTPGRPGGCQLCPLSGIAGSDLGYEMEFLDLMMHSAHHLPTPDERAELRRALAQLRDEGRGSVTLTDLALCVSSHTLREIISAHTVGGGGSLALLDGDHNPALGEELTTFECGTLLSRGPLAMLALRQIFHLIEGSFTGEPMAIVIDEAWMMLSDPMFAAQLTAWFKTVRKYNVLVIIATQSLHDLVGAGLYETVLDCAKTRIYLANADAASSTFAPIYQKGGLGPGPIGMISRGVPKRDYFLHKGDDFARFSLVLSRPELRLLSMQGEHQVGAVDALCRASRRFYLSEAPLPTQAGSLPAPTNDHEAVGLGEAS
ncbi:MAG: hypothetical protein K6A65_08725 [Succinivibrionaceae bacterium]|nr:hypothetical protein [Succinivibrionaceae bacterium]